MKEIRYELPPNRIWFTSDIHFGHANIIKYSNRPFKDVEDMNQRIIRNWNDCVQPGDAVWHLGDLAMTGDRKRLAAWISQLNGDRYAILGNHDVGLRSDLGLQREFFKGVFDMQQIKVKDADAPGGWQRITLLHYGMQVWNKSHHGAWQLYGHSHGNLPEQEDLLSFDAGCDATAARLGSQNRIVYPYTPAKDKSAILVPENYRPISYAEVKSIMKQKTFKPVDHHGMAE